MGQEGREGATETAVAPALAESTPFPWGPPNDGGVVWLGVIQRPDRLAFSRVYAAVSTVLSARAFPRLSVVQGIAKLPCPHYLVGREGGALGAPADLHHLPPGRTVTLAMCAWVCLTTYTHDFQGEPGRRGEGPTFVGR